MKIVFLIVSACFCYSSYGQVKGNDVTTPVTLIATCLSCSLWGAFC
jgi:hypothetical protein